MKTPIELKSCLAILLFSAGASSLCAQPSGAPPDQPTGLAAEVPGIVPQGAAGTPAAPPPGDVELPGPGGTAPSPDAPVKPGSVGTGLTAPQLSDPNLPGADSGRPPGEQPAFLQIQEPASTGRWPLESSAAPGSPPGAQSLIRRRLRAEELGPWTAAQVTGEPNTLTMGDYSTAWAAAVADAGEEWLRVQFTVEADLDRVRVVQSYNPGAITKVTAERGDGQPVVLQEMTPSPGVDPPPSASAVAKHARHRQQAGTADAPAIAPVVAEFAPPAGASLRTTSVRITIDERKVPGWNEIDAVEIVSRNGARQWAQAAKASGSFGDRYAYESLQNQQWSTGSTQASAEAERLIAAMEARLQVATRPLSQSESNAERKGLPWSPEQATGAPDTPVVGDCPTAWAPLSPNGGKEWLDVTFARPSDVREVRIVESSQTHAITAAQVYVNGALVPLVINKEEAVRVPAELVPVPQVPERLTIQGDAPGIPPAQDTSAVAQPAPHTVSAWPESASLPAVQKVRIELDSTGLSTWPEIDAVELVGTDGSRQWAARAEASSTYAQRSAAAGGGAVSSGYQRANTLEEANQRIELLTRRLERLEQEVSKTKKRGRATTEEPPPSAPPGPGPAPR